MGWPTSAALVPAGPHPAVLLLHHGHHLNNRLTNWSCAPVSRRATSVLQTEAFACSLAQQIRVFTAGVAPAFQPPQGRVLSVGRREHRPSTWYPRQDSHLQPSRSKRGAPLIELRGNGKSHLDLDSHQDKAVNNRSCYFDTTEVRNWPLEPELRRPVRVFGAALIYLSHPAQKNGFVG